MTLPLIPSQNELTPGLDRPGLILSCQGPSEWAVGLESMLETDSFAMPGAKPSAQVFSSGGTQSTPSAVLHHPKRPLQGQTLAGRAGTPFSRIYI